MKRMFALFVAVVCLPMLVLAAQHVTVAPGSDDISVTLVQSSATQTIVRFDVSGYSHETVDIGGQEYSLIRCGKEAVLLKAGEPALPHVSRSIIIPDDAEMNISVIESQYEDYPNVRVAPSKGNLLRTVDPATVPYVLGPVYQKNAWYPEDLASLRDPYILRDLRGTVIDLNPFEYNPALQTLRVYTSVTVDINAGSSSRNNVLTRARPFDKVDPTFDLMYQRHFLNYGHNALLYTPVPEEGELLIITYDSFHTAMLPFVNWKIQKGIKTTIVDVSTIGNNYTAIRNYIQSFYNNPSHDLAYVLLVGDGAQVASPPSPPVSSGHGSDPQYSTVGGTDAYPDLFVGRFSATTEAQVQTQVERSIEYERDAQAGANWYHLGTCIGSDQGPGHNGGEYDYQHENNIRTDLLGFTYTAVDQIYDPGATAAMVSNALNAGRSIINYTGHGSETSWGTTGFSNTNVAALTNDNMLPFIFSVACVNGDFTGYTCFAEAWLRSTHNGQPIGAVATYMSSINQSWDPPMDAQDECSDLLIAHTKTTIGGLFYDASCRMMDLNAGTAGTDMFYTWHIFGDPSLQVRTATPQTMAATHDGQITFGQTSFAVTVAGVQGALCALSQNGTYYGSAYTNASGLATINIVGDLPVGGTVQLTITAFNKVTYVASLPVITGGPDTYPPILSLNPLSDTNDETGPYVLYASIRDLSGVASATFHYSFDSTVFVPQPMVRDTGYSWRANFGGYPAGTKVYYYLTAVDSSENQNVATSPVYAFSVLGVIFSDDVESGAGEWTNGPVSDGWANQWHISTTRSHSGTHAWKFGDTGAGTYADHAYGGLVTPSIYLRGQATLTFWQWMIAERSGSYSDSAYDGGAVDIAVDGAAWTQLTTLTPGYNRLSRCTAGGGNPYTGPFTCRTPIYSDTIVWTQVSANLDSYAGHNIQLRFRFGSDASTGREGWYVDDITLLGLPPLPETPTAVNNLTLIAFDPDSVRLEWTSTGAPYYKIFSGPSTESPFEVLEASVSGTSYDIATSDLKRYFVVVASTTP
jgi:hypothetical protein